MKKLSSETLLRGEGRGNGLVLGELLFSLGLRCGFSGDQE